MKDDELFSNVKMAIRESVIEIKANLCNDSIIGYALCTDDCLGGLFCCAVSSEALRRSGDPDLLYCPTDWPPCNVGYLFEAIDKELRRRVSETVNVRDHVDEVFELLINILVALRAEGFFDTFVFLSVLSTDPSPYLEMLELHSIENLNRSEIVEGYKAFLGRWS